jgi:hypothetical protein
LNADAEFASPNNDGPSLVLGWLRVWILEKAVAETAEWYDGNVLRVRAECSAAGATVTVVGPLFSSNDIYHLLSGMEALHDWTAETIAMTPLEPNLAVTLKRNARGSLQIEAKITPDHKTQEHRFIFDTDLSYLPAPIAQCREILRAFPAAWWCLLPGSSPQLRYKHDQS